MKAFFGTVVLFLMASSFSSLSYGTGGAISGGLQVADRAIYIDIYGMGPAVDAKAYANVRNTIGSLIAQGKIDKFVVYGYGIEGGMGACIELSQFADASELLPILEMFRNISVDHHTTSYDLRTSTQCQ